MLNAVKALDANRPEGNLATAALGKNLTVVELAHNIHASFTLKPAQTEALLPTLTKITARSLDAPQPFAAAVRPFIVRATRFVVMLEPTLLGVTGARAMLTEMTRFGISRESIMLVTNQRDPKVDVTKADIEKALEMRVSSELPPRSDRRSPKAIEALASYLAGLTSLDPHSLQPSAATPLGDRRITNSMRRPGASAGEGGPANDNRHVEAVNDDVRDAIKTRVHEALSKRLDIVETGSDKLKMEKLRTQVAEIVAEMVVQNDQIRTVEERRGPAPRDHRRGARIRAARRSDARSGRLRNHGQRAEHDLRRARAVRSH